ncbi:xanthine dehydrogenase molybdopterin binding subunit [Pokkaliibacter sp. CJK22405]|uniref:xanthine dehydrogenase molybdopterin binding subunit n=1 Tax=Pokkaliibacter sp. CJK22405 TaxID=3384615 RepID=UPI003984D5A3
MRKLIAPAVSSVVGPGQVGKAHPHESARLQVKGEARYVTDIPLPQGSLYGVVVLASQANAAVSLHIEEVRASEGVAAVMTAADIPGHQDIGPVFPGDPLLVMDKTLYVGQALFLVAATSETLARAAAAKARIEYAEAEPLALDPKASVAANLLVRPTHVMERHPAAAITSGEISLSSTLEIGGQEHFYLETQATLAIPGEEGALHLHCSTQHPSEVQKLVAEVLNLPLHLISVEVRRLGGGFGGKETQAAGVACMAALLASKTQRPVVLRLNRQEDMRLTGKRHPFVADTELTADAAGMIQSLTMTLTGNCGCSPDLSEAIVDRAMFHADNAYYLPDATVTGFRAFTHTASNTAFRGFGGPQGMLAIEAAMDDLARTLQEDPFEVRLRNLYDTETRNQTHYGQTIEHFPVADMMLALADRCDYRRRYESIREANQQDASSTVRRGIALTPVKFGISFTAQHLNQAGALVHIYTDGSVQVNHGGIEMGQGLHIKMQQIAADAFALPLEQIRITATRTDKVPNTSPTAASSGADLNGQAVQDACMTLRSRLTELVAQNVGVTAAQVSFNEGDIEAADQRWSFAELVQQAYFARVSLSATGYYRTPRIYYDREKAEGHPFYYFAHGVACSEVEVDTLTGEYRLLQVDILHDVGHSLNPAMDKGQIEGGFVQGLGWLTTEELVWDEQGRLRTDTPATYKIPTLGDVPARFNTELLTQADHPAATIHRSKAVGEPPFMLAISAWCALRDALSDIAPGRPVPLNAPATPEAVWRAARSLEEMHYAAVS